MALKRVLGAGDAGWLVAGNMIGAGIFLTPGLAAAHLPGAAWLLAAWLTGGLLALAGAAVYAELGTRLPEAGGDYRFLAESFGHGWAFLTGWAAFLLTFSGAAAAMARVSAEHFDRALGGVGAPVGVTAALLILGLTAAHAVGARVSGRTTTVLTAAPLVALAGMFVVGLVRSDGAVSLPPQPFRPPESWWPLAFGAAMVPVYFTYSGWNAAAYLAGEVRDPRRNLPRGLLLGTAAVTAVYLLVNTLLVAVLPAGEMTGSITAVADAARRLVGPDASRALAGVIGTAVLGSAHVTLMAGARIYYAMSVDGFAPAALGRTGQRGVPHVALWAGGVWSALLAAAGDVQTLVEWTTLAILLLSAATVAGLFVLRKRNRGATAFPCPGYPWVPLLYLGTTLAVSATIFVQAPRDAAKGLALVLAGWPVYRFLGKGRRPSGTIGGWRDSSRTGSP